MLYLNQNSAIKQKSDSGTSERRVLSEMCRMKSLSQHRTRLGTSNNKASITTLTKKPTDCLSRDLSLPPMGVINARDLDLDISL
jgi:hypothetical protein